MERDYRRTGKSLAGFFLRDCLGIPFSSLFTLDVYFFVLTIGTHFYIFQNMEAFKWDEKKNQKLKKERNLSFEQVVFLIENDCVIDIIRHPKQSKYNNQRIYIILIQDYVHLVPFVDSPNERFLKTIIPSRKFTKLYKEGKLK